MDRSHTWAPSGLSSHTWWRPSGVTVSPNRSHVGSPRPCHWSWMRSIVAHSGVSPASVTVLSVWLTRAQEPSGAEILGRYRLPGVGIEVVAEREPRW